MPSKTTKYTLNGKVYNIPEDVVAEFEKDNPEATQAFKDESGIYDIAVKDRERFLNSQYHKGASLYDENEQTPVDLNDANKPMPQFEDEPNPALKPIEPVNPTIPAAQQEGEYVEGLGKGLAQGTKAMGYGAASLAGETLNSFTGSSHDKAEAAQALDDRMNAQPTEQDLLIQQYQQQIAEAPTRREKRRLARELAKVQMDAGYDDFFSLMQQAQAERDKMSLFQRIFAPSAYNKASSQIAHNNKIEKIISDAIDAAGGDVDVARANLAEAAEQKTIGDKMTEWAQEGMADMLPTKGFGAWVGNLIPQMIPSAAAIAAGVFGKNPKAAEMIGKVGLATMSATTAGMSMAEARNAGATDGEVWGVGIADGVTEFITEKIPFDRYTKRIFGASKAKMAKELGDVLNTPAGRSELEDVLQRANKELGGRLFNKKNVTEFLTDVAAEGVSEFAAEAIETITPMIYQSPEEYPTLANVLENGWEGMKGGLFMGAILGGASKAGEFHLNNQRRKQQGFVAVGEIDMTQEGGGDNDLYEIFGVERDENGNVLAAKVMRDGQAFDIDPRRLKSFYTFSIEDFNRGYIQMQEDEAYSRGQDIAEDFLALPEGQKALNAPQDGVPMLPGSAPLLLEGPSPAQALHDAQNKLNYTKQQLAEKLGVEDLDEKGLLDAMMFDTVTPEQQKIAIDYLNAKSAYQGIVDGFKQDIDERIQAAHNQIDANTNKDTGKVERATMKVDDRQVYIVGGYISRDAEGFVDKTKSEGSLIVKDIETGEIEMVSPEAIFKLDEPLDPANEKNLVQEEIRQGTMQAASDAFEGKLQFKANDTYTLTNPEGVAFQVMITPNEEGFIDNGDGTVNVILNPNGPGAKTITPMAKEEIQALYEAAQLNRLQNYEMQETEQNVVEAQQRQSTFKLNDDVALRTDDGEVRGQITAVQEDGTVEVYTERPVNGQKVNVYTQEELLSRLSSHNGEYISRPAQAAEPQPQEPETVDTRTALERIPVDEAGEQLYEKAPVEDSFNALVEQTGSEADALDVARQMVQVKEGELAKVSKASPKAGKTPKEIIENKKLYAESVKAAQAAVDYWKSVLGYPATLKKQAEEAAKREKRMRMAEARRALEKNGRYGKENAELGQPLSFREYVMRAIASGSVKFKWSNDPNVPATKGLGAHLGLLGQNSEMMRRGWALSKQDGLYPEQAAEELLQSYSEELGLQDSEQAGLDTQEAFNEILDVMLSYDNHRAMMDAAKEMHGIAPEDAEREYMEQNTPKSAIQGLEHISEEDILADATDHITNAQVEGLDINIVDMKVIGSRIAGTARPDSDLDILVEYDGDMKEDAVFNALNDEENRLAIAGINVDFFPIRKEESGSMQNWLASHNNGMPAKEQETADDMPSDIAGEIEQARQEVNVEPTEGQKKAGNYKMGHIKLDGYEISLENPKGSVRKGVDENGKAWESEMKNDYGYLRGTEGVDGDHIDVFLSDAPEQGNVFVVDQVNPKTGEFDEHKVMYGFNSIEEAKAAYLANYEEGWQGLGNITPVSKEEFKKWVDSSHRKTKPFAEYASVKPLQAETPSTEVKESLTTGKGFIEAIEDVLNDDTLSLQEKLAARRERAESEEVKKLREASDYLNDMEHYWHYDNKGELRYDYLPVSATNAENFRTDVAEGNAFVTMEQAEQHPEIGERKKAAYMEQQRAENEEMAKRHFAETLEAQGDIQGTAKKPGKIDLFKYTAPKGDQRVAITGVFHDKGLKVATDSHIIIAKEEAYDKALEGKAITKDGATVPGNFPKWRDLFKGQKLTPETIDIERLAAFIQGVKAKAGKNFKDSTIGIRMSDGEISGYAAPMLEKFVDAARSIGGMTISTDKVNATMYGYHRLNAVSGNNRILMMPRSATIGLQGETYFAFPGAEDISMAKARSLDNAVSEMTAMVTGRPVEEIKKERHPLYHEDHQKAIDIARNPAAATDEELDAAKKVFDWEVDNAIARMSEKGADDLAKAACNETIRIASTAIDVLNKEPHRREIQSYLEGIADEDSQIVVTTSTNILSDLKELGYERFVPVVKDQMEQFTVDAFQIPDGPMYIIADNIEDDEHARKRFVHERTHNFDIETGYIVDSATPEEILGYLHNVGAVRDADGNITQLNDSYDEEDVNVWADELLAHAMEIAYSVEAEDVEAALRKAGLDNEKIINFVKTIDNEQRKDSSLRKARDTRKASSYVDVRSEGRNGEVQGTEEARQGEVELQGPGLPSGSEETGSGEQGADTPGRTGRKIEDYGEEIAGARKFFLRDLSKKMEKVTEQALIANPLAKVFTKPNFGKLVASGAIREVDAIIGEAICATIHPKPKAGTKKDRSAGYWRGETLVEKWARETNKAIQTLNSFFTGDEAERDNFYKSLIENKFPEIEKDDEYTKKLREWNPGQTIHALYNVDPVWFAYQVLLDLGYESSTGAPKTRLPYLDRGTNSYRVKNANGDSIFTPSSLEPEEVAAEVATLIQLAEGKPANIPLSQMSVRSTGAKQSEKIASWRVYGMTKRGNYWHEEYNTKEEAEARLKKAKDAGDKGDLDAPVPRYGSIGIDWVIYTYDRLNNERIAIEDMKFETREEAKEYAVEHYDEVVEKLNTINAALKNVKPSAKPKLVVGYGYGDNGFTYTIDYVGAAASEYSKKTGSAAIIPLKEFKTRKEAEEYLNAHKDELLAPFEQYEKQQREFAYFDTDQKREGEDYRKGRDITAEELAKEFGFRGVQFGNWANDKDRQMALNQAYDALMDLSKITGLSPRALSLNGELGMAFGARGTGNANAHYEPDNVVINLTKTRGAGSLAHEWLHAIDNYLSRQNGDAFGMVTAKDDIPGMRDELRESLFDLMSAVRKSDYYQRSKNKSDYFGRDWEVMARLFAEYVNDKLASTGETNKFLSRGIDPGKFENIKQMNYLLYKLAEWERKRGDVGKFVSFDWLRDLQMEGVKTYEEWLKDEKNPLGNFPYPTKDETAALAPALERFFQSIKESETEEGNVLLFAKRPVPATDIEYEAAVQAGDLETAKQMVEDAAARAFPDTKVVDKDGKPLKVRHLSAEQFYTFENGHSAYRGGSLGFFTDEIEAIDNIFERSGLDESVKYNCFLNIRRPLVIDLKGQPFYDIRGIEGINDGDSTDIVVERAYRTGRYDGVILRNVGDEFAGAIPHNIDDYIPFFPDQVKLADTMTYDADGNLVPLSKRFKHNKDIRFAKANRTQNGFISNAAAAVERIKMEKATPAQWKAMIAKEGGMKAAEDKWLGLSDWLDASQAKTLSKDEVMGFINTNSIQIEEDNYSEDSNPLWLKELESEYQSYLDEANGNGEEDIAAYAMERMKENHGGDDFEMGFWGDEEQLYPNEDSDYYRYYAEENGGARPINSTRLSYTTENLSNKREIALTVPTIEPWNEYDDIHFGDAGEGRAIAWVRFGDTMQIATDAEREAKKAQVQEYYDYTETLPLNEDESVNVEALSPEQKAEYERLKKQATEATQFFTRTNPPRKLRILFIDEIQSKRHQTGREEGYADAMSKEEYEARRKQILDDFDAFLMTVPEYKETHEKWVSLQDHKVFQTPEVAAERKAAYDRMSEIEKGFYPEHVSKRMRELGDEEQRRKDGVPSAPFEKNWHELAFKRILRLAAEEGYDKVAWTTGETQAERYGIGNVITSIFVGVPLATNTREVVITKPNGYKDSFEIMQDGTITGAIGEWGDFNGKNVVEVFGKNIGEKILNAQPRETIDGNNLRVGGEGMKGFYDQILPAFVNKYGKKWGVKVADEEIFNIHQTAHVIDVTPEMKESVLEGQVMFAKRPKTQDIDWDSEDIVKIKADEAPSTRAEAKEALRAMTQPFHNIEQDKDIYVSQSDAKHTMMFRNIDQIRLIGSIDKLIENAHLERSEAVDESEKDTTKAVYRYSCPVMVDDRKYIADMVVKEYVKGNISLDEFHLYNAYLKKDTSDKQASSQKGILAVTSEASSADKVTESFDNSKLMFAKTPADRSLVGLHNISEGQLRKAMALGGLANPSTAIVDIDKQAFSKYGEISLLMPSSLVDARTGRNPGTAAADLYSPNYPTVHTVFASKDREALKKWIEEKVGDREKANKLGLFYRLEEDLERGDSNPRGLEYIFAKEKGAEDLDAYEHTGLDNDWRPIVSEYDSMDLFLEAYNSDAELQEKVDTLVKRSLMRDYIRKRKDETGERRLTSRPEFVKEAVELAEQLQGEGLYPDFAETIFKEQLRAYKHNGEFDRYETLYNVSSYISRNNLQDEYNRWAEQQLKQFNPKEQLYVGTDHEGRQKYVPNTLANASKIMRKQGLANTDGFFDASLGGVRAEFTPMMRTLAEIRRNRWRLDEKAFEEAKDELENRYMELANLFDRNDRYEFDAKYYRLIEAMKEKDPAAYAEKEYNVILTDEDANDIKALTEALKTMPTAYFELKFQRPVMLDEFAAAVVPDDASKEVVNGLKDAGLDIFVYDHNDEEDRVKVTREASRNDGIRFAKVPKPKDYAEVVASGDEKAIKKMVVEAAAEAMPNTKVVDRYGKPRIVYHGTPSKQKFNEFNTDVIYLNSNPSTAIDYTHQRGALSINPIQTGRLMPCFVNLENPLIVDAMRRLYTNIPIPWREGFGDVEEIIAYAKENGYDGVIVKSVKDNMFTDSYVVGDDIIAFRPEQVKSTGPTYVTRERWHYPWDKYEDIETAVGPTYDDLGNLIPLTARFNGAERDIRFAKRTKAAPKKTAKGYKLMRLGDDGLLYPLFIDSKAEGLKVGEWYDADSPKIKDLESLAEGFAYKVDQEGNVIEEKAIKVNENGKMSQLPSPKQVASTKPGERWITVTKYSNGDRNYQNLGINGAGSVTGYAMRPGWHLGDNPVMTQIGKGPKKDLRDDSFVWVEVEFPMDRFDEYEKEKMQRSTKDIATHIPEDGAYIKGTSSFVTKDMNWYIAGAIKPVRIIGDVEARSIIDDYNRRTGKNLPYDYDRESGRIFDAESMRLEDKTDNFIRRARKSSLADVMGQKDFNKFLLDVYSNLSEEDRRFITGDAIGNGLNFRDAVLHAIAKTARANEYPESLVSKAQEIFNDLNGVKVNNKVFRYLMWREEAKPQNNGAFGTAEDIVVREHLGLDGISFAKRPKNPVNPGAAPSYGVSAQQIYESRLATSGFQFVEAMQDSMLGLKRLYDAVTEAEGKKQHIEDIPDYENAYLAENSLSSVNLAESEAFSKLVFKPILDEVKRLAPAEGDYATLIDYMMAKHGLERNTHMNTKAKAAAAASGDVWTGPRDYAGLTDLTGDPVDYTAKAQDMVDAYEADHDTAELWKRVRTMNEATLAKMYEGGLMSADTFNNIRSMYQYYIPLRGFEETISSDIYGYLRGDKDGAFTAPIRRAEGRTSKADDPLATMANMADNAILQANRNLMKQKALNFVLNHPSDLVSVSDLWLHKDPVTGEWKPVFAQLNEGDSPAVIRAKVEAFEQQMEALASSDPDNYKRGKEASNIPYKTLPQDLMQHQVVVKRGGRAYVLTINGNPRAAQALNGETNPDNNFTGAIGALMDAGLWINRNLSSFYTTRYPDFVISNTLRDMLYGNTMVWVRESPAYAARFNANYAKVNPVRLYGLLKKYDAGTLDMSDPVEKAFNDFILNGGETGWTNIKNIEKQKKAIKKELRKATSTISVEKVWDMLGEKMDYFNRAAENCARFAAFLTSRQMGRTMTRSVYDAKEITVNFNKKGAGSKFYKSEGETTIGNLSSLLSGSGRSLYVFWNAAIQGSANFFKGAQKDRNAKKWYSMAAALFIGGLLMYLLNADDDEEETEEKNKYLNQPENIRRSNILFRAGNQYVALPLPVEYRMFYGMGELAASALAGREQMSAAETATKMAGQITQVLPIDFLEGGGKHGFIPSAVKPAWEAYVMNEGWTGLPIYKDNDFNKNKPSWTKAYSNVSKPLLNLAQALNPDPYYKSGIDINPARLEYLLNGYFGGYYKTANELVKMAETVTGQREFDWQNIMLANRVLKTGDERTNFRKVNEDYYRYLEEYNITTQRLNGYQKEMDGGEDAMKYAERLNYLYFSPEFMRHEIMKDYKKQIDKIGRQMKEAQSDEEYEYLKEYQNLLKEECVDVLKASSRPTKNEDSNK